MSSQYGELRPTSSWDHFVSLGHPRKFKRLSRRGSVTARHSSSGRQPDFAAALNRGSHLYSAGRPSRWALAHIVVIYCFVHIFFQCLVLLLFVSDEQTVVNVCICISLLNLLSKQLPNWQFCVQVLFQACVQRVQLGLCVWRTDVWWWWAADDRRKDLCQGCSHVSVITSTHSAFVGPPSLRSVETASLLASCAKYEVGSCPLAR